MSAVEGHQPLTLYGYFRSSCTGRVRIALLFKQLSFEYIPVNLVHGSQHSDEYEKTNPSHSVPTLVFPASEARITQSMAALEHLEEEYPDTLTLLPKDPVKRSQARSLANIMACDVQPVTNLKILKKVESLGYDRAQWSREYHADGFKAFEAIVQSTAGKYSVGDEITVADICLVPAVWNAERYGLSLDAYPTIRKVYENVSGHPAFRKGHWKKQPDCPEGLR